MSKITAKCRMCGKTEHDIDLELHHIIPKSIGGTDKDGRMYLCKKHHRYIHNLLPKIIWPYVIDKEGCKKSLIYFSEKQKRF